LDKFDEYSDILNKTFGMIAKCEEGLDITKLIDGPVCHAGFKRLN